MMKTWLMVGAFTFAFASSCAASNGGGHVVGNSMISESAAKEVAAEKKTCECKPNKGKKVKKDCECPAEKPKACGAEEEPCVK